MKPFGVRDQWTALRWGVGLDGNLAAWRQAAVASSCGGRLLSDFFCTFHDRPHDSCATIMEPVEEAWPGIPCGVGIRCVNRLSAAAQTLPTRAR
jgi:hypothetical protein